MITKTIFWMLTALCYAVGTMGITMLAIIWASEDAAAAEPQSHIIWESENSRVNFLSMKGYGDSCGLVHSNANDNRLVITVMVEETGPSFAFGMYANDVEFPQGRFIADVMFTDMDLNILQPWQISGRLSMEGNQAQLFSMTSVEEMVDFMTDMTKYPYVSWGADGYVVTNWSTANAQEGITTLLECMKNLTPKTKGDPA